MLHHGKCSILCFWLPQVLETSLFLLYRSYLKRVVLSYVFTKRRKWWFPQRVYHPISVIDWEKNFSGWYLKQNHWRSLPQHACVTLCSVLFLHLWHNLSFPAWTVTEVKIKTIRDEDLRRNLIWICAEKRLYLRERHYFLWISKFQVIKQGQVMTGRVFFSSAC